MTTDEQQRKNIRLREYDYSLPNAYFVTICVADKKCIFGTVSEGAMALSLWGIIADECWRLISENYPSVFVDAFIVMPNHIHGVVMITDGTTVPMNQHCVGATFTVAQPRQGVAGASPAPTDGRIALGNIVGGYKSTVANKILKTFKTKNEWMGKVWQRGYYEHIIRNEEDLLEIRQYIANNPRKWEVDQYYRYETFATPRRDASPTNSQ